MIALGFLMRPFIVIATPVLRGLGLYAEL